MSNHLLLETIEKQISAIEGKLQKEAKHNETIDQDMQNMKEWLKFLHEKRKQIMQRSNEE